MSAKLASSMVAADVRADVERQYERRTVRADNPKKAFGDKKPPLAYIPLSAKLAMLEAFYDGQLKYGSLNWRVDPVEAMTYVEGAMRHLELFKVGEELTRDTLVKNLGAVMACCAILIDAQAHGTMIDNRPKSQTDADLLYAGEEWVSRLRELQAQRVLQLGALADSVARAGTP